MGTKNCPESPRQKMINMMYLVLTAMLALNVAAETLTAFQIVDESLLKTYVSLTEKNRSLINDFKQAHELNKGKVERWMNQALDVQTKSDSLVAYLNQVKVTLAEMTKAEVKEADEEINEAFKYIEKSNGDTLVLKTLDDLNVAPELMLTRGKGKELQSTITTYRDFLISLVGDRTKIINNLETTLDVSDPERGEKVLESERGSWAEHNFTSTPVVASLTLLSKMQIDVRNAESAVLRHLYNQIDAASFKFTGLRPTVIPNSSYLFEGQEFRARIFLSAEDTTQDLRVFMNGSSVPLPIEDNEAIFRLRDLTKGDYEREGYIEYMTPEGDLARQTFELDFKVEQPNATIAATKMNVLFKNLQNPISISVPGVSNDNIDPVCTNGKMYKQDGEWIIEPEELDYTGDNTSVIVYAELDGAKRQMAEMKYRVMKVPDPVAQVAGKASGAVPIQQLRAQNGVFAQLKDFYFDLRFEVTSFDLTVPTGGGETLTLPSDSYVFTREQKRLINNLGAGDKVLVENIKAKIQGEEADELRQLSPVVLTVQ